MAESHKQRIQDISESFIELLENSYMHVTGAAAAVKVFKSILIIKERLSRGKSGILNQVVANSLIRIQVPGTDSVSFHVAHLKSTDEAIAYFNRLITQVESAIEFLMYSNRASLTPAANQIDYIPYFLLNIRDSDIGCMEARLRQAFDFISALQSTGGVVDLNSMMHAFFQQIPEAVNQSNDILVFQESLAYFGRYVDFNFPLLLDKKFQTKMGIKDNPTALTWDILKGYFDTTFSYDLDAWGSLVNVIQRPTSTRSEYTRGRDWHLLYFVKEQDAEVYLSFIKSILPQEFQAQLIQARITQSRRGYFRFRLSDQQFLEFTNLIDLDNSSAQEDAEARQNPVSHPNPMSDEHIEPDDYLVKIVRGDRSFIRLFAEMTTPTPDGRKEFNLRRGQKKKFTVTGNGIFERATKPPTYTTDQKQGYSPYTSTTLVNKEIRPPLFGANTNRRDTLVAFYYRILSSDGNRNALFGRMLRYDRGTVDRPYDHHTLDAAADYYERNVLSNQPKLFSDFGKFKAALRDGRNINELSEILARLRWEFEDEGCGICIASDTEKARWLALEYARVYRASLRSQYRELGLPWRAEYQIPLKKYQRDLSKPIFTEYTADEQQKDRASAEKIFASKYSIFVEGRYAKYKLDQFEFLLGLDDTHDALKDMIDSPRWRWSGWIIRRLLDLSYYHIIEALIEKDGNPAKNKENLSGFDQYVSPGCYKQLINHNRLHILDWFRRMGFKIRWVEYFHHKLTYEKVDTVTGLIQEGPDYEDLSTLAYLFNQMEEDEFIKQRRLIPLIPLLKKAVKSAVAIKHRHQAFAYAFLQSQWFCKSLPDAARSLLTEALDLTDKEVQRHIFSFAQDNPMLVQCLFSLEQFDMIEMIIDNYSDIEFAKKQFEPMLEELSDQVIHALIRNQRAKILDWMMTVLNPDVYFSKLWWLLLRLLKSNDDDLNFYASLLKCCGHQLCVEGSIVDAVWSNVDSECYRRWILELIGDRHSVAIKSQHEALCETMQKFVAQLRILGNIPAIDCLIWSAGAIHKDFFSSIRTGDIVNVGQLLQYYPELINESVFFDDDSKTPLHYAVEPGQEDLLRVLLAHPNLNPNCATHIDHYRPLHSACWLGNVVAVKLLLADNRVLLNQSSSGGMTALHMAVVKEHEGVVRLLLAGRTIDVARVSKRHGTAYDLASRQLREKFPKLNPEKYSDLSHSFPKLRSVEVEPQEAELEDLNVVSHEVESPQVT